MCGPVLPLVATGLGAIGSGIGTLSAINRAKVQASAAEANAGLESQAAAVDQQNMRQSALQRYRQMAAIEGQQRTAAGANGVVADYGTPAEAVADTHMLGNEDLQRIYTQANQTLMGHDIAVANDLAQASLARSRASTALIGGLTGFGSGTIAAVNGASGFGAATAGSTSAMDSLLSSANQYDAFRNGLGF